MYLKELTLKGFKSFASATTLRFEPGITAVVGPNGSGKSNIVDALTWVMGEQGAKNLRGSSMEDVIFAGTSSRPALGRAQVSLTIDNSDRALDIDYTEVTISRTIFRNGGSEYAINGSSCRLLDIQELLSDTGLGSQMHVIVGQGKLDQILHADPSGHRALIEEAAGILKHRKRKERALHKLSSTERNLARLDDLLAEIHRQLGPLGRQARISRRADGIEVTLRDAQSRLLADDATQLIAKRDEVRSELTEVRGELAHARRELAEVKVRIEQVEAQSRKTSPAIARLNAVWHDMSQIQERLRSLSQLAQERQRSLTGQIATNLGEDPDLLLKRADEFETQAKEQNAAVSDARMRLDKATEQRADQERQLASIRQTITALRKSAQQRESQLANLREMIAREEALAQSVESRREDFAVRRRELAAQLQEAKDAYASLEMQTTASDSDDDTALQQARIRLEQACDKAGDLEEQRRTLDTTVVSLQAKADALFDTLDSRNASGELERDQSVTVLGHLADFIRVREGWEEAVAHALEAYASALVVPDAKNLMSALQQARDNQLGRAVVLDAEASASHYEHEQRVLASEHGDQNEALESAALLIAMNPSAKNTDRAQSVTMAVQKLLADTAATATIEAAHRAVTGGSWRRAVAQTGEVFTAGVGAVGGSSLSQSALSLVARRDKALAKARELSSQLEELKTQLATAQRDSGKAAEAVQQEQSKLAERRMAARQAAKNLKAASDRIVTLSKQSEELEDKLGKLEEERKNHQLNMDNLQQTLQEAMASENAQVDVDEMTAREHDLETALASAREAEMNAKMQWTEASRQVQSLERQVNLLRGNARQAEHRRAHIEEQNSKRRAQAAKAEYITQSAQAVAKDLGVRIQRVESERQAEQQAASVHDDELTELRAQRNEIEPLVSRLSEREHGLDVEREQLAAKYGQLEQQISDDLGMTLNEAVSGYGPDQPVPVLNDDGTVVPLEDPDQKNLADSDGEHDESGIAHHTADGDTSASTRFQTVPYVREEQTKRLERAKRDLAKLGKVNPLATEEYEALQARNQYLNDQRNDVVKSREDLLKLVRQLDATMIEVFKKAFDDTAAAFEQMFGVLFPGGCGTLKLEDPDDLLNTGVLVQARPAGKRVKQLSLLSGGERSLTALAFLFAIFTARPSPFYVMDEVEAALDDVNLTRLINAFNELREHAQLIIITHQQRTMSIADALYGVTMRADGVTAVISQRLEHR